MDKVSQKPKACADDAVSVTSKVSRTSTQIAKDEEEIAKAEHEAKIQEIRKNYVSILDKDGKKYNTKMVGLNPNMRPSANQSLKKIFPMQGLWSSKQLMKSTTNTYVVPKAEQQSECEQRNKDHFKKMYKQKEYMEEYLKFKEVIAGMKK